MFHLLKIQRAGNIEVRHKAGNFPTGDLTVIHVVQHDDRIPPSHALGLLRHPGLLVLPVNVGDRQPVQLPHRGQHRHGELIALVSEQVGEVGAQQDDALGQVRVILAGR